jgi:drug/metabolite transporter (DMT)-like permease
MDRTPLFLLIGIAGSILLAFGLLLMKSRGPDLAPAEGAGFARAIVGWLRDPLWLGGLGVQIIGYALYVIALSGAPVSMLAVVMQGGIAVFVVCSALVLRERADAAEWLGIGGVVTAMLLLGISLQGGAVEARVNTHALVAVSGTAAVIALMPYLVAHLRSRGIAPALASGILFGLGSLYAKAITQAVAADAQESAAAVLMLSPWLYLAIAANLCGLVLLQNSFHWARGIVVMPLSSALSNLVPIAGGMIAFGERLPSATIPAAMRVMAFLLTVVATGLLAAGHER